MSLNPVRLLAAALLLAATAMAATQKPPVTPNVLDETDVMKVNYNDVAELQANLVEFQDETGIKLYVQYLKQRTPSSPDDFVRSVATKLGLAKHGILLVHFANDPDWQLFIADDLVPQFVGKPGTAGDLVSSGALREAKAALLKGAISDGDKAYAMMRAPAPDPDVPTEAYHHIYMRIQTAALQDALKAKFVAP